MGYRACFTGHRPQKLRCGFNEEHPTCIKIKKQLQRMIVGLIEKKNVTHFLSGFALGTDLWAAEIVSELKEEYPNITLEAVLPCENQTSGWNIKYKEKYNKLLSICDKKILIQKNYTSNCMMKRNKYLVDNSDYVVAVWNGDSHSGTANTIRYAKKCNKVIYAIDARNYTMKAL